MTEDDREVDEKTSVPCQCGHKASVYTSDVTKITVIQCYECTRAVRVRGYDEAMRMWNAVQA